MMTDDFKVGNDFKQGDRIASILFNIASEYVIRQMSVGQINKYKSVKLLGYADDTNLLGRTKISVSEVYKELKEKAK